MLKVLGDALCNLSVDATASPSLTTHLHFSVQEPALDPGTKFVVLPNRVGVKQLGKGCLDLLVDLVQLVAVLAAIFVAQATAVLGAGDGGERIRGHWMAGGWRRVIRLGGKGGGKGGAR